MGISELDPARQAAQTTAADPSVEVDLLRFSTAGSVDDGKSTLIGRLLYDTRSLFEDQLAAVEAASRNRGDETVDLALLTDGLRAEREQRITIDVAYRYFRTPRRRFIIADTPGHIQYTRNLVTGASTAELAIVLVDARKGVLTQSRRHGFLTSLLQVPHIVVAINKMDLVDYRQDVYRQIQSDYRDFATKLQVADLTFIPVSALHGDNIVEPSDRMDWYDGPTLLHHLENVSVGSGRNLVDFRFPVQYVIRPRQDYRGFAGQICSGRIRAGEEIVVLPSGVKTRIRSIDTLGGPLEEAFAGDSVVFTLEDEVDVTRGDMMVRTGNLPRKANRLDATLCWMSEEPMDRERFYWLQHTTRRVRAYVTELTYRVDVDTMHREKAETFHLNEIGRVQITTTEPLFFDQYNTNRQTGSFILIDAADHSTVAAGMIRDRAREVQELIEEEHPRAIVRTRSSDTSLQPGAVSLDQRQSRNGHKAAVLWFTGLSGSGKSTLARALEARLYALGCQTTFLDGDNLRHGLCGDLGFDEKDRRENIRRASEVARLAFYHGQIVLCSFISPFEQDRQFARGLLPEGSFLEIYVKCDLSVCKRRDPRGLYRRAMEGEIKNFTGVSAPYEEPAEPEVLIESDLTSVEDAVDVLLERLEQAGILS
ncbi:MAG: sulfate adenylyltransferase subunit CysN [Armatimonadetes bacterium]|nr:sulfate adenylyltransferase subunit CysN [Armatimonadota bacterium]